VVSGGGQDTDAARKRVAVEMIARHERVLRRTASRYSICAEDAEDAFQRALEILLTKAPPGEARELVRWMQTVTKHEALAVRRNRERHIGTRPPMTWDDETTDWLDLVAAQGPGPAERAERAEAIARSREALKTLKPAELRALTLLAEGYSYAEIGELTGYSRTKINRCLAEGRERFRAFISRSESGERCGELRPILSAFCDGEASPAEVARLREHLRACAHCRATMRAYRAAPRAVAVLTPAPFALRSLLDRLYDALGRLHSRLPGPGRAAEASLQMAAGGGSRGAGNAALAKLLAVCAGTAGGAACIGAGVVPGPLSVAPERALAPQIERIAPSVTGEAARAEASTLPASSPGPTPAPAPPQRPATPEPVEVEVSAPTEAAAELEPVSVEGVEPAPSEPPPAPPVAPVADTVAQDVGGPAGEFGP
jgi:RNA polymerase sigma factor (sigma-70 family)